MLKTQTGYKWKQLYYIISKKKARDFEKVDFLKRTGF